MSATDHEPRLLDTAAGSIVDASEYTDDDLRRTIALVDIWWRELGDSPATASFAQEQRRRVTGFAASIGAAGDTLDAVVDRLAQHAKTRSFFPVRGPAEDLLRKSLLLLFAATAAKRSTGELPTTGAGVVRRLSVSDGGVPKRSIEEASIGWRGLDGDRQKTRLHHGRPWQAVCLWSVEVIDVLRAEGHTVTPGAAGENVTLADLDWTALVPGVRLRMGSALLEVSLPAEPCSNLTALFTDGRFSRIHPSIRPRNARLYASVIEPGSLRVGDSARIVG